jgi:hypothetical protein
MKYKRSRQPVYSFYPLSYQHGSVIMPVVGIRQGELAQANISYGFIHALKHMLEIRAHTHLDLIFVGFVAEI